MKFTDLSKATSGVPPADTILYNGKILTVDNEFRIVDSVAIRGGKFIKVGSKTEIDQFSANNTISKDLEGKTILDRLFYLFYQ